MQKQFIVLLGDIVHSRRIKNRKEFQQKLKQACNSVNLQYKGELHAEMKLIKGVDEIGGVYNRPDRLYDSISIIMDGIFPQKMRFVCISGQIDVGLMQKNVSKMDGPAFHKAAENIDLLRKRPEMLFHVELGNHILDIAICGQINLLLLYRDNWSQTQFDLIQEYRKCDNQAQVAEKFGISQQAVSKSLISSKWLLMRKVENDLPLLFRAYSKPIL